jgi:hypothetical protein
VTASSPDRPTPLTRVVFFVGGALVGGVIGYGFVSSGPGPTPSLTEPYAAAWVFGSAAFVGIASAIGTWGVFRRRFSGRHPDDDR